MKLDLKSFLIFGVVPLFVGGIFYTPALALEQTAGELSNELAQVTSPSQRASSETTTPEALTTEPASLITTAPIEATDLGVPEPSSWQFFKRKFLRVFSFSQFRQLKLDIELTKLTLLKARQAQNLGNTTLSDKLLADYQTKVAALANRITTITESLKGKDPQADQLLTQIEQDLVLEASLLDQLGAVKTTQLQKKLFKAKIDTLKHLTRLLAKENLPPEQLARKIGQLSERLVAKEAKIEKKIAKRLALIDNLDEADEKDIHEEALEKEEGDVEEEIAQAITSAQTQRAADSLIQEILLATRQNLVVLQRVLEQVPSQAQPAIQAVIDRQLANLAERMEQNPKLLEKLLTGREEKARFQLLERLKEQQEGVREEVKKAMEKSRPKVGIPTEGSEVRGEVEAKTQSVTIEAKEGKVSPSTIEVEKNSKLTIRFRNRDRVERALTFSNGASTGTLPAGGETETVLTVPGPLTFEVKGVGSGRIVVK